MAKKNILSLWKWLALSCLLLMLLLLLLFHSWIEQRIPDFNLVTKALSIASLSYFKFIGTDRLFAYLFLALIVIILYQWHVHRHIAYKALFLILSLSVSLAFVYSIATFFERYIPKLAILAGSHYAQLLNDPRTAFPSGHIARLSTLITSLCILFPRRNLVIILITIATLIFVGLGLVFDNHYFLAGEILGILLGIVVPLYVKKLIFVQRIFSFRHEITSKILTKR